MSLVSIKNEIRNESILNFIQENEPCTFGNIKKYLENKKMAFEVTDKKNERRSLARKLKELLDEGKITRDGDAKPYPTYSTVQDYSLDTAIMGESFRKNYIDIFLTPLVEIDGDYLKKDIPFESCNSDNEKFIKSMVTRYGFYMLSMLIKSYEQSITRKHFDRKIWIEKAMDLMKDESLISESFLTLLGIPFESQKNKNIINQDDKIDNIPDIDEHPELEYDPKVEGYPEYIEDWVNEDEDTPKYDLTKKKNKQLLKNKLENLRNVMEITYPKLHQCINIYDNSVERHPKKIKSRDIEKVDLIEN